MIISEKHPILSMTAFLAVGEAIVCSLTLLVYYLIGRYALPVLLGALVGMAVMVGNFLALAIISNRAVDRALTERKAGELDEEQLAAFVEEHQTKVKLRIRLSQNVRMVMMLALLIVALVTPWFDPIAALIPMLLFRPILMLMGLLMKKKGA